MKNTKLLIALIILALLGILMVFLSARLQSDNNIETLSRLENSSNVEVSSTIDGNSTRVIVMLNGEDVEVIEEAQPYIATVFRKTEENAYIGLSPSEIDGYILYGGPVKIYSLNFNSKEVSEVEFDGFAADISPDETMLAFISGKGDESLQINVLNLSTRQTRSFDVGDEFQQAGDAIFSPDNKKLAYQASIGNPENERSEIFIIDLSGGEQESITEGLGRTSDMFEVQGWKSNSELNYL